MHLNLHPSVGNVSVHTGRVGLTSFDFDDTGALEEITTCTVWTESPFTEGPVESLRFELLLFTDSPAEVLVMGTAEGGTAEYFLFDAAEPGVRMHLNRARDSGKLCITGHHAGEVTDWPVGGPLFQTMPCLRRSKTGPQRAEWLLNAARVAQTLPHTCSLWTPDLVQVTDHRAYLIVPA